MKIAVAAMCKNESRFVESYIRQGLEADYIFILDTGSTDDTYCKLQRLATENEKVQVVQQQFDVVDYSKFRNALLDFIRASAFVDYIFYIDMDEVIQSGWRALIDTHLANSPDILKTLRKEPGGFITQLERVFRNAPGQWVHALHEGYLFEHSPTITNAYDIELEHLTTVTPAKIERYMEIIRREMLTDPEHYLYFYFLHIYSDLKDYELFMHEFDRLRDLIEEKVTESFKHLLYRYALQVSNVFDPKLLDAYLKIENKSTLFIATRYCGRLGQIDLAMSLFNRFEKCQEDNELKYRHYVPSAYDEEQINIVRTKLNLRT